MTEGSAEENPGGTDLSRSIHCPCVMTPGRLADVSESALLPRDPWAESAVTSLLSSLFSTAPSSPSSRVVVPGLPARLPAAATRPATPVRSATASDITNTTRPTLHNISRICYSNQSFHKMRNKVRECTLVAWSCFYSSSLAQQHSMSRDQTDQFARALGPRNCQD